MPDPRGWGNPYAGRHRLKVGRKHACHTVRPLLGVIFPQVHLTVIDIDGDGRVPGKPSGRDRSRRPVVVRLGNPDRALPAQQPNRSFFSCCQPFWPAARRAFFLPPGTHRGLGTRHGRSARALPPTRCRTRPCTLYAAWPRQQVPREVHALPKHRARTTAGHGELRMTSSHRPLTSETPTPPCAACGRSRCAPTGPRTPRAPRSSAAPPRTGAAVRR